MNSVINTYIHHGRKKSVKSNNNKYNKIIKKANEIYSELDALENMSVSLACRSGLEYTFCCSKIILKTFRKFSKLIVVNHLLLVYNLVQNFL